MNPGAGVGIALTATVLGITHGIEPDHVAGIMALSQRAASSRLSAFIGGCFAVGHVTLVVLWVAVVSVFDRHVAPAGLEEFGLLVVGVVLALVSLSLGVAGTRGLLHGHRHDHGEGAHTHYHVHLPATRLPAGGHGDHHHAHGAVTYLKVGAVGALFTLSPPLSMLAFVSVGVAGGDTGLLALVVAVYAVAITGTMVVVGGGVGTLDRLSKTRGKRFHAAAQVLAALFVLALALDVLGDAVPGLLSVL